MGVKFRAARRLFLPAVLALLSFAAPPAAPPQVVSVAPADVETNVFLGAAVCVTFSADMDHPSAEAAFSLLPATAGAFSWSGNMLIFTPAADLAPSTFYQVGIAASAQDSLGAVMSGPFSSSFTTGTLVGTPLPAGLLRTLLHLGSSAADRITDLPFQSIETNVLYDLLKLGGQGFEYLQQPIDGRPAPLANMTTTQTPLVWTALTDADGIWNDNLGDRYGAYFALYLAVPTPRKATLVAAFSTSLTVWMDGNPTPLLASASPSPSFDLAQGIHVFVIKHGDDFSADMFSLRFADELGADLTDLRYFLDDVVPPRVREILPAAAATGVPNGTDVVIQFSEAMDTTVPASSVAALTGGTATGSWAWTDPYALVWTPAATLAPSTLYTVTITPAQAKDLRGLALAGPAVFTFTTAGLSTPSASSILPTSAASGAFVNLATLSGSGFQKGVPVHPAGARPYGGHYYKFSEDWNLWGTARSICTAAGGHLATLGSLGEDDFVWRLGGKFNCWMGMSDVALPGGWRWENGEATGYTNWYPGEPNNFIGQGEHWGAYWYGFGWNDTPDAMRPWVCEFDNGAPPTVRLQRTGQPDILATGVIYNSSGSVSFNLNLAGAPPGAWDVQLTNPDGSTTLLLGAFTVNPPPPIVTNVTSSAADGVYGYASDLIITVTFSQPVFVTGSPNLTLETGPGDAVAPYTSGSGTNTLSFTYSVAVGHNSADLDYVSTSALNHNGSTILNATNTQALLNLPTPGTAGSLGANKNLVISTPVPAVTNVTSSAADGTYGLGQVLTVNVTFSQTVIVTGSPRLTLETGTVDRLASYSTGSGTNTLSFTYTVSGGDASADLDYASTTALAFNGGTIKNALNQIADLTLPAPGAGGSLGANKNLQIVTPAPPTVVSVTSSASDGAYGLGENITISVVFSEAVFVTGTPTLTLETGSIDAVVNWGSGNGTTNVAFPYQVAPGHTTPDLDYVSASALALNGGTIRSAGGTDANVTLPAPGTPGSLGANKNLQIITPPPTVVSVTSGESDGPHGAGEILTLTITFSQAIFVTGTPTLTLETGAVDAVVNYGSGSGSPILQFPYHVAAGETSPDLDYVSISALSLNGGTMRNSGNVDAVLTLPAPGAPGSLGANKNLQIVSPGAAVAISATSPNPNGTYGVGQVLTVNVTFSQAVFVTGAPQLLLETGAVDRFAPYLSGSGTSTLSFAYTVAAGDASADLDYVTPSSIQWNGGTIRNGVGLDTDSTLPAPGAAGSLGANKDILISTTGGTPPTIVNITIGGGCGLTGAEAFLLVLLCTLIRNGRRKQIGARTTNPPAFRRRGT